MKGWERAISSIALGVFVFVLTPPSAGAAVVLEFEPAWALVGERVAGRSDESGTLLPDAANLKIFLAPSQRAADRARGPNHPRLTAFGELRVDVEGIGRFNGTVPDLPPGDYVAVGYCRSCIPGGSTFTIGEFTVSGATLPTTGSSPFGLVSLALLILTGGVLASLRSGRPPRRGMSSV